MLPQKVTVPFPHVWFNDIEGVHDSHAVFLYVVSCQRKVPYGTVVMFTNVRPVDSLESWYEVEKVLLGFDDDFVFPVHFCVYMSSGATNASPIGISPR